MSKGPRFSPALRSDRSSNFLTADVVEIGAAHATTCARKRDQSVHCWGSLGGTPPSELIPAQ